MADTNENFFDSASSEITVNGEAKSAEGADASPPATAPVSPADKAEKTEEQPALILGKFKTQADLEKSYTELEREFARSRAATKPAEKTEEEFDDSGSPLPLDPTVVPALDNWYFQRRETERAMEFERNHAEELKDPLVRARVQSIIRENNVEGRTINQEDALKQAQEEIEQRMTPELKEAEKAGFKEGQDAAKAKAQAGAIGASGKREPVDVSKLSSKELEEYLSIPRV
jgi:hypothetical protein